MGFMDLRQWITLLDKDGELRRIKAEVDWDREMGAIARRVLEKKGPALLFENIKGYRRGRPPKHLTGGPGRPRRPGLALRLPQEAPHPHLLHHLIMKKRQTPPPPLAPPGAPH